MARALRIGEYEVLRKLAAGGMGTVYVAVQRGPEGFTKLVAIKQLHPHLELGEAVRRRFAGEARIGGQLDHPNIVNVLGYENHEGTCSIIMEYVHGCDLGRLLRAREERVPVREAVLIASELLHGLEAVHGFHTWSGEARPVIHRDVSPKNILLSDSGDVKIADFGVALISGESFTTTTGLRGTVPYMSPEQASGEPLDQRTDLFTVGLVLYELLSGQQAYDAESEIEQLNQAREGHAARLPLPDLPADVCRVVRRALARDRDARYPDAGAFRKDLDRFLDAAGRPSRDALAALVRPHVAPLTDLFEIGPDRERVTQVLGSSGADASEAGGAPAVPDSRRPALGWIAGAALLLIVLIGAAVTWSVLTSRGAGRRDGAAATETEPDAAAVTVTRPASQPGVDSRASRTIARRRRGRRRRPHGTLHLNTLPVWSKVWIDGHPRGTTPVRVQLRSGRHQVTLRAVGRGRPVRFWIRINPGRVTRRIHTFRDR